MKKIFIASLLGMSLFAQGMQIRVEKKIENTTETSIAARIARVATVTIGSALWSYMINSPAVALVKDVSSGPEIIGGAYFVMIGSLMPTAVTAAVYEDEIKIERNAYDTTEAKISLAGSLIGSLAGLTASIVKPYVKF